MKKILLALMIPSSAFAQEAYQFSNPSFSGNGFSNHALAIEQTLQRNRASIKEDEEAAIREAERELENSNTQKFIRNVESRIYAQISKELVERIFGENPENEGSISIGDSTVSYVNNGDTVTLTIISFDGSTTTIEVPIGSFGI